MKNSFIPELDPGFFPAAVWNRNYRELAAKQGSHPVALCLERANGAVSRLDTVLLDETPENAARNLRYIERIVKFMLWAYGGWKLTVAGAPAVAAELRRIYSPSGERAFVPDWFEAAYSANEAGIKKTEQKLSDCEIVIIRGEGINSDQAERVMDLHKADIPEDFTLFDSYWAMKSNGTYVSIAIYTKE